MAKDCESIPASTGPGFKAPAAPALVPAPPTGANLTKGSNTPDTSKVKG